MANPDLSEKEPQKEGTVDPNSEERKAFQEAMANAVDPK